MTTKICVAGAAGNVGRHLVKAILDAPDLELAAGVGDTHAGEKKLMQGMPLPS